MCGAATLRLTNVDLLLTFFVMSLLTHISRVDRAGILSGVSHFWRRGIWSHEDLYRTVVLLASTHIVPRHTLRTSKYGASHFVNEGALPMLPAEHDHPLCFSKLPSACVEAIFC